MNTNIQKLPQLDARLALAASFVVGDRVVDVGTDHAYLPIYLLKSKKVRSAAATDINKGPLERARINAAAYSLDGSIDFYLTDGLGGVPLSDVTDIVICGMGGELIARIIDDPRLKNTDSGHSRRLILQPMSAAAELRQYLAKNGFEVTDGGTALASGKLYQCIVCRYCGRPYEISAAEAAVGAEGEAIRRSPLYGALVDKEIRRLEKALAGKRRGGEPCGADEQVLRELYEIRQGTVGDTAQK